jgi:hypothetical protein
MIQSRIIKVIATWYLKGGIVETEEMAIARQQLDKRVSAVTDTQATIDDIV